MMPSETEQTRLPAGRLVVVGLVLAVGLVLLLGWRDEIGRWLGNAEAIRATARSLGVWGPLLLIALIVAQIVVAPIPGYAMYLAAGFLYGTLSGGIYGSIGLLLGGMAAMAVSRAFGQPIVEWLIGRATLAHWEEVSHSDSLLVWGVLLLSPIGDAPFLLAGLSHVAFWKIFVLALATRVPGAFVAAALGAGAMTLTWWQLTLIIILLGLPLWLVSQYRQQIRDWLRARGRRAAPLPLQNIESDE